MNSLKNFTRPDEMAFAFNTEHMRLMYYDLPKNFEDEYKSYDAPRFCTILSGQKRVAINDTEAFNYSNESFILLPPNASVRMQMPEHTKALVYEFDPHVVNLVSEKVGHCLELSPEKTRAYDTHSHHQHTPKIKQLTQRIETIFDENDPMMGFLMDLACQELIFELLRVEGCHQIIHHQKNHPIYKAVHRINQAPEQVESLQALAHDLNMSASNFTTQFKQVMNVTPNAYITQARMKKACHLLQFMPVTEVAFELGYQNISHFIRLFKTYQGVTPKQYQMNR